MKYFAKIKYVGTYFHGFQVQPNQRTVQGELTLALGEALGAPCKVTGCSRTDSGVHANEFCITIEADGATIPPSRLPLAASRFLPSDVALTYAESCGEDFHPRYSVKSKEYVYKIRNSRISDPFLVGRVWFLPAEIPEDGITQMRDAAEKIVGTHDFTSFMAEGSDIVDAVRTVYYLDVIKDGDDYEVRISADGFLYNMVRIIVGTLIDVAYGRIDSDKIASIIEAKNRALAGTTAPPDGLYLNRVIY